MWISITNWCLSVLMMASAVHAFGSVTPSAASINSRTSSRLFSSQQDAHAFSGDAAKTEATDSSANMFMQANFGVRVSRTVHPSIVLVTPTSVRDQKSRGSGFIIDKTELLNADSRILTGSNSDDKHENVGIVNEQSSNDDEIYIVTAAHVAAPGLDIQVSLLSEGSRSDENRFVRRKATVVGRDVNLDLALLRVNCTHEAEAFSQQDEPSLPSSLFAGLQLYQENDHRGTFGSRNGSPGPPEVGTLAFSHGFPASRVRGATMTLGIVCGIAYGLGLPDQDNNNGSSNHNSNSTQNSNDSMTNSTSVADAASNGESTSFVVTDAAMSGGMSGGPLTDIHGRVMGVNALIRPDLRALGNYAVSVMELRAFLATMGKQLHEEQEQLNAEYQNGEQSSTMVYHVVLYNDRFNKRERVSKILQTIAALSVENSTAVMMEAHTAGRGIVRTCSTVDEARSLCQSLREQDVLVEVEPTRASTVTEETISTPM